MLISSSASEDEDIVNITESKAIPIASSSSSSSGTATADKVAGEDWMSVRRNKVPSAPGAKSFAATATAAHNLQQQQQPQQQPTLSTSSSLPRQGFLHHGAGGAKSWQSNKQHHGSHPHPQQHRQPVTIEEISATTAIELYGFPPSHRTSHLRQHLQPWDHKYRLKWQNDSSCWVVFDDPADVPVALEKLVGKGDTEIHTRPFDPANMLIGESK